MEIKLKDIALQARMNYIALQVAGKATCITELNNPDFTLDTTLAGVALAYFDFNKKDRSMLFESKKEHCLNSIRFSNKYGDKLHDMSARL